MKQTKDSRGRKPTMARYWGVTVLLTLGMSSAQAEVPVRAVADLAGCSDSNITGQAVLKEEISNQGVKEVSVSVQVLGLEKNTVHAVHIHETGLCTPCGNAGGHFDPGPKSNTNPDGNHPYHAGDLVNLHVDENGVGVMEAVTNRITLSPGPISIFDADGAAFIVHVDPDTYCPDGVEAGCAGGSRAACGVITLRNQ